MIRLRLISLGLAALVCVSLIAYALLSRFDAVMEMFNDTEAVKVEIEDKEKPKPPPPPPPDRPPPPPPPEQRVPPPDLSAPPTPTPIPVAVDPPPAPPVQVITNPQWIRRPGGADLERWYPRRAKESGIEGRANLDCIVDESGRLSCAVVSEEPANMGFGEAAVRMARAYQMRPLTVNGEPTAGGRVRLPIRFRLAEE